MTPFLGAPRDRKLNGFLKEIDVEILRSSLETLYNQLIDFELELVTGIPKYQRGKERKNYRNGSRKRVMHTIAGQITLRIPKLRQGSYLPSFLEAKRLRDTVLTNMFFEIFYYGLSEQRALKMLAAFRLRLGKNKTAAIIAQINSCVAELRNSAAILKAKKSP